MQQKWVSAEEEVMPPRFHRNVEYKEQEAGRCHSSWDKKKYPNPSLTHCWLQRDERNLSLDQSRTDRAEQSWDWIWSRDVEKPQWEEAWQCKRWGQKNSLWTRNVLHRPVTEHFVKEKQHHNKCTATFFPSSLNRTLSGCGMTEPIATFALMTCQSVTTNHTVREREKKIKRQRKFSESINLNSILTYEHSAQHLWWSSYLLCSCGKPHDDSENLYSVQN